MYGVFVNEGHGEKCVFKDDNLITVMQKQSEYVKKAKKADQKGKKHNIVSCRFAEIKEET